MGGEGLDDLLAPFQLEIFCDSLILQMKTLKDIFELYTIPLYL